MGYAIACTSKNRQAYGWQRNGGMAPYILCDEKDLIALPDDRFLGVGIAIPSLVSPDGETTVYGMSSNFTGVTRRFFSEYIPYPVKMYHDSETAGFAEIWRTTDRGNMIYLKTRSAMSRFLSPVQVEA